MNPKTRSEYVREWHNDPTTMPFEKWYEIKQREDKEAEALARALGRKDFTGTVKEMGKRGTLVSTATTTAALESTAVTIPPVLTYSDLYRLPEGISQETYTVTLRHSPMGELPSEYHPTYFMPAYSAADQTISPVWSRISPATSDRLDGGLCVEIQSPLPTEIVAALTRLRVSGVENRTELDGAIFEACICPDFFAYPEFHKPAAYNEKDFALSGEAFPLSGLPGAVPGAEKINGKYPAYYKLKDLLELAVMNIGIMGVSCPFCGYSRDKIVLPAYWFVLPKVGVDEFNGNPSGRDGWKCDARLNLPELYKIIRGYPVERHKIGTVENLRRELGKAQHEVSHLQTYKDAASKSSTAHLGQIWEEKYKKLAGEYAEALNQLRNTGSEKARLEEDYESAKVVLNQMNDSTETLLKALEELSGGFDRLSDSQMQVSDLAVQVIRKFGKPEDFPKYHNKASVLSELAAVLVNIAEEKEA